MIQIPSRPHLRLVSNNQTRDPAKPYRFKQNGRMRAEETEWGYVTYEYRGCLSETDAYSQPGSTHIFWFFDVLYHYVDHTSRRDTIYIAPGIRTPILTDGKFYKFPVKLLDEPVLGRLVTVLCANHTIIELL